ncbi:protocatechuate dioxygenase [Rhodococcus sp. NPDC058505]|uniref:protocatechuate dioxygenase n=1 Tax=Rhodococcus sp. NPDC058505 TaxID=3346531 RepID=UPI0036596371
MNKDIESSRARVSRRRALALGGTVGLSGLIAACSTGGSSDTPPTTAAGSASDDAVALLARAPQCVAGKEETQGPYWFDVDSIRNDIREDRPGTTFEVVLRIQDSDTCTPASGGGIANAVVEIWHCDAGGVYSGFESGSRSANGYPPQAATPGGPPTQDAPGADTSFILSNGSYSAGDVESATTDDGTYLRGAQVTDGGGIATFTTIFPGWYTGRTSHIHLRVHIDKKTVLTTQLYFPEDLIDEVYARSPYVEHTGREANVTNATDSLFDESGMLTVVPTADGYRGAVNIGV